MHTGENPNMNRVNEMSGSYGAERTVRRRRAGRVAAMNKTTAVPKNNVYQSQSYPTAAYTAQSAAVISNTREWTMTADHSRRYAANAKTAEIEVIGRKRIAANRKVANRIKDAASFFTPRLIKVTLVAVMAAIVTIAGTAVYVKLHSTGNTGFEKLFTSDKTAVGAENIENQILLSADTEAQAGDYGTANSAFEKYSQPHMNVMVSADGNEYEVSVPQLSSVGDVLRDMNITLTGEDYTNYPLDMALEPDMKIMIGRVTYSEYSVEETVPFDTEYRSVQTIKRGTEAVQKYGSNGTMVRTYKQRFVNGELESETLVSETTTVYPQTQIVLRGTGGTYTNAAGVSYNYSYYLDVTATAYSTLSGITYSGKEIELGMIAVDPTVIPLGTQVYVVGDYGDYGVCSAEDTGGAIKGNKIDIYLGDDMEVLMNFGIRKMRVYILE